MIRINFIKPRKPFKEHREDWKKKWSMAQKRGQKTKLTDQDVIFCRRNYLEFGPYKLAEMFKVHHSTIRNAVSGLTFIHLNGIARPRG